MMKYIVLFFLLATTVAKAQVVNRSVSDSVLYAQFDSAIIRYKATLSKKDVTATLLLFTDSMQRFFKSYEDEDLKSFIKNRWCNDKYFMKSLSKKNNDVTRTGNASFRMALCVQYPRKKNEDGDGTLCYFLSFRRYGKTYKIFNIEIAG